MTNNIQPLSLLPDVIKSELLGYLDPKSLGNQGVVDKIFKKLVDDPATWTKLAKRLNIPIQAKQDPKTAILEHYKKITRCALKVFPDSYKGKIDAIKEGPFAKLKAIESTFKEFREHSEKYSKEIETVRVGFLHLIWDVNNNMPDPALVNAIVTLLKSGIFSWKETEWSSLLFEVGVIEDCDAPPEEWKAGNLQVYKESIEQIMKNTGLPDERKFELLEHQATESALFYHHDYKFFEVLYEAGLPPNSDQFEALVQKCPERLWNEGVNSPLAVFVKHANAEVLSECLENLNGLKEIFSEHPNQTKVDAYFDLIRNLIINKQKSLSF